MSGKNLLKKELTIQTAMYKYVRDYLLASLFVLCSVKEYICLERLADVGVFIHCTQTATDRMDATPQTIIPLKINVTADQIFHLVDDNSLRIDLCPDRRFLKISWNSAETQRKDAKLCYHMLSAWNDILMDTVCYNLHIFTLKHPAVMNCWFPMEYIDKAPIVFAWVYQSPVSMTSLSGSLNTSTLDPAHSCTDVCEVAPMQIGSKITCRKTASVIYDKSTVVKHLSFHINDNSSSCDSNIVQISSQTDTRLDYQLNCSYRGKGHIKVLYSAYDKYCLKYQQVIVYCSKGSTSTLQTLPLEQDNIHSFGTFVIFGIITVIIIAAIFFGIIFLAQWVMYLRIKYHRSRRGSKEESRNASISMDDSIPLNTRSSEMKDNSQADTVSNTQGSCLPQRKSPTRGFRSTTFNSIPERDKTDGKPACKSMRKSVTMALLEDTNPFYKKKILFLPKPYDHFTHEATKILNYIFDREAGVTCQCCYDRGIHKHYMTSNRDKWINNILGDHDRILIFLCFKSLSAPPDAEKYEVMVDEILGHLVLQRNTTTRLCKIMYLHFTESPKVIEKKHHGDNFYIHDTNSYKDFVCDVLNYCGRSKDEYPDVVNKTLNCRASIHFLKYIGMNGGSKSKSGNTSSHR